jgi:hypothetical protein
MGSGYGEFRSIYNKIGEIESGLTYAGVEGFNYAQYGDVNFSGIVSQTPNIDSMYSVGLNEDGQIVIGFTQNGQTQESTDWSVTVGTLNTDMTVNGLFANTTTTVIGSGLSSWTFGSDGSLQLPAGGIIKDSTGTNILDGLGGGISFADAPSTLSGAVGDVPGLLAFDSDKLYYSTGTYSAPTNYIFTSNDTLSGIMIGLNKGLITPVAGWTITNGIVTRTMVTIYDNTSYWYIELDGSFASINGEQYTVTSTASSNIWKQIPFFPDTYGSAGQVLTTDGFGSVSWATTSGGGLAIGDFGRGFTDTLDSGKITTSKLYNRPANLALNNHFELSVDDGGTIHLPDQSMIMGATLKTVPGNYAALMAGPVGKDEDSQIWVDPDGAWIATKYSTDAFTWKFGHDGLLTFPGEAGFQATFGDVFPVGNVLQTINNLVLSSELEVCIRTDSADTAPQWTFGNDGKLTLPTGGEIKTAAGTGDVVVEANDGTARTWTFGGDGSVTFPDTTVQNTAYKRTTGSWTVAEGSDTYSFTVPTNGTYVMWVKGAIDNGIIMWNATASVSNTNVPVIGQQFAWNYTGGGTPIEFTAIPTQFIGTANMIVSSNPSVGTTSNKFDFVINNTSGGERTVYWGYVAQ